MDHAGAYSATLSYLAAVKAVGSAIRQGDGGTEKNENQRHVRQKGAMCARTASCAHDVCNAGEIAEESKYPWYYYKSSSRWPVESIRAGHRRLRAGAKIRAA